MFCQQSLPVSTIVVISLCYMTVTVFGLRIKPRNTNERFTSQKLQTDRATRDLSPFRNFSSSWKENSDVILNNRPTKRQTQPPDVDESDFDNLNDRTEEFVVVNNKEEAPSTRQVILEPNVINALRLPHPYPFQPLHSHWISHMEPVRIIPRPFHVHHYRRVPVAIQVPKYEHVPEPFYVPYKPKPDYTVMHVHVYDPGLYNDT